MTTSPTSLSSLSCVLRFHEGTLRSDNGWFRETGLEPPQVWTVMGNIHQSQVKKSKKGSIRN